MRLRPRALEWLLCAIAFATVTAAWLLHASRYADFLSDDALISLRYARRLVEGHGLTWSSGERVEGYSDLLWVLLTAALGALHLDYIRSAMILDHVGIMLAIIAAGMSARTGAPSAPRLMGAGAMIASSIPLAVWANGGLEHGLMVGVLALALYLVERRVTFPDFKAATGTFTGLPLAALVLFRVDGALLAVLLFAGAELALVFDAGPSRWRGTYWRVIARRWLPVALVPTAAVALQLAFRRGYYGSWVPNTALAKIAFTNDRLSMGLDYLGRGYRAIAVLLGLAVVATVSLRSRTPGNSSLWIIRWVFVIGWSAYLVAIGGDIFPGWRQLLFVLVPLSFFAGDLAESWVLKIGRGTLALRYASVLAASTLLGIAHYSSQRRDSENERVAMERWEWAGLPLGKLLKTAFGPRQALLAVDAAGALPYWSELPALDMLGLNDAYIAHHPPSSFGHGQIGHELGDGAYVFGRAPDVVAFNGSTGAREPIFLSGRQLLSMPEFARDYQLIGIESEEPRRQRGDMWIRRESERIGIVRGADTIEIPGYFFASARNAVARLDARGSLVAAIDGEVGTLRELPVPAGRWEVRTTSPDRDALVLGLGCELRSMQGASGAFGALTLDSPRFIDIALAAKGGHKGPITITNVRIVRVQSDAPSLRCALSGQPLVVPIDALQIAKPEHLDWAYPTNFIIGTEGLVTTVETRTRIRRIELSADNDDDYELAITRGAQRIWRNVLPHVDNGGGLALRTADIPDGIELEQGDQVRVTPERGDGRYSVGYLTFEN